eukprot:2541050-Rhodomonas_salina.1
MKIIIDEQYAAYYARYLPSASEAIAKAFDLEQLNLFQEFAHLTDQRAPSFTQGGKYLADITPRASR